MSASRLLDADNGLLAGSTKQDPDARPVRFDYLRRRTNVYVIIAVTFTVILSLFQVLPKAKPTERNVILMISDGFGPASQVMARNYYKEVNGLPRTAKLPLDDILVGSSRTLSSSSFVTDSAAGATAFACALKTYNGAIGVASDRLPCATVLEAAKAKGFLTALVVTSRITHATPASFSAHVPDRNLEQEILLYQLGNYSLGRNVDLMFGGGYCFYLPKGEPGSCRTDDADPKAVAGRYGWNVVSTRKEFDALSDSARLPLAGLFALDHISYEIDRNDAEQPSLSEMAAKALKILKANCKGCPGFFLMIEGSRIDMAAHRLTANIRSNDAPTHVREILEYNKVINETKKFVEANPGSTMISVSDHETGGVSVGTQLTAAYPTYEWKPLVLANVKNSSETISKALVAYSGDDMRKFVSSVVLPVWMDVKDATDEEVEFLATKNRTFFEYDNFVTKIISRRAVLGWSTHGHSAVDVNLYAYGVDSEKLRGNHDNTDIGKFIIGALELDMDFATSKLGSIAMAMPENQTGHPALQHFHQNVNKTV
ncbi:hypothetical protein HDU96_007159 [Phlyctochytrium bullatum]|nr:hypothetical protein HDU96_007159 [Phlyctochytrium bullatum]